MTTHNIVYCTLLALVAVAADESQNVTDAELLFIDNITAVPAVFFESCPLAASDNLPLNVVYGRGIAYDNNRPVDVPIEMDFRLIRFVELDDLKKKMSIIASLVVKWAIPCSVTDFCQLLADRGMISVGIDNCQYRYESYQFKSKPTMWYPYFHHVNSFQDFHGPMK